MSELEPAWRAPSPRLLTMRRVQVGASSVAAAAVLFAVLVSSTVTWSVGAAAAVLVAGAVAQIFVARRVRAWGYAEREDDLLVKRGVLFSRLSVIPYGRMQFVDVTAGPVERLFGLATVRMHTAAAASDARIPGLESDEAARVRDRLTELGEAQAAGL
ncbi:MAG TPA: PH domain-containing protein [Gaiellaceae bacterium]